MARQQVWVLTAERKKIVDFSLKTQQPIFGLSKMRAEASTISRIISTFKELRHLVEVDVEEPKLIIDEAESLAHA